MGPEFPFLDQAAGSASLAYLDNAATTQKPRSVIDRIKKYYERENSNIHRGIYDLSEQATQLYESARQVLGQFLGAQSPSEIVFVRGVTEAANLVAASYLRENLHKGDEVVVTLAEHHSNFLPWQRLAKERGASLRVVPISSEGTIDLRVLDQILSPRVKLIALTYVSNVLGTINPLEEVVGRAKEHRVPVFVDAAQAAAHLPISVSGLGVDFLACSGHKMYGPTGIGVLYGRSELLSRMQPFQVGGDMVDRVSESSASWREVPYRFEAGTPNIAGAIGLASAVEWLSKKRRNGSQADLTRRLIDQLDLVPGLKLLGARSWRRLGIASFVLTGCHPHDVASILNEYGVAVRAGFHCAEPLPRFLGYNHGSIRASLAIYNTSADIDRLVQALVEAERILSGRRGGRK